MGRLVGRVPAGGQEVVLPLQGVARGIYSVRCGSRTQRLVVE